jgi:hypothetical protein
VPGRRSARRAGISGEPRGALWCGAGMTTLGTARTSRRRLALGAVVALALLSGCRSTTSAHAPSSATLDPTTASPTIAGTTSTTAPPLVATAAPTPTAVPRTSSRPTPLSLATAFVGVRPVTSTGRLASGYTITQRVSGSCGAGSEVAGRAYRCFSGHEVIDPCWRATDTAVDCLPAPWSRSVISISVAPLGQVTGTASSAHDGSPWGLTLRDGRRCA